MRLLLIDNHDSFTYNLVQLLQQAAPCTVDVVQNDTLDFARISRYHKIVLSPGPGLPRTTPNLLEVIARFAAHKPILGVCLGHQAIAEYFGARLFQLQSVVHGLVHPVRLVGSSSLFRAVPSPFEAGLYHSWAVDAASVPPCLEVTAVSTGGVIMALRHKQLNVQGIQFHPESIMTPNGHQIMANWITG